MTEHINTKIQYRRGVENGRVWYSQSLQDATLTIAEGQELSERTCFSIDLGVRQQVGYPPKDADAETKRAQLEQINEQRARVAFEVYARQLTADAA